MYLIITTKICRPTRGESMAIIVVVIDEDVLFVVKCFMPNGLKVCIAVLFVDSGSTEDGLKMSRKMDKSERVLSGLPPLRVTDKNTLLESNSVSIRDWSPWYHVFYFPGRTHEFFLKNPNDLNIFEKLKSQH